MSPDLAETKQKWTEVALAEQLTMKQISDRTVHILIGVFSSLAFIIIVIVILLVLCLCKYKRRRLDIDDDIQLTPGSHEEFDSVNWAIVQPAEKDSQQRPNVTRENILQLVLDQQIKYEEEFSTIPTINTCFKASEISKRENEEKLRWPPEIVTMYDYNRVTLKKGRTDFINASYINGKSYGLGRYIATQGPLKRTIEDFWQMVWEQNSYTVVMLCHFTQDKWPNELAVRYWPEDRVPGQEKTYGNIAVKVVKVKEYADYILRLLRIRNLNQCRSRDVNHFHYLAWDNIDGQYDKVPKTPSSLLDFIRKVRRSVQPRHGPPVVHCSAGTGESGIWIATDILTSQLQDTGNADVYDVVFQLRQQRSNLVHFVGQYTFLYRTLVESELCHNAEIDVNFLQDILELHLQPSPNCPLKLKLENEFKQLQQLPAFDRPTLKGRKEEHIHKNRSPETVIPYDDRIVEIMSHSEAPESYINASWVDGYYRGNAFIVTQDPLKETVSDFWNMVWQHGVEIITMLSDTEADCLPYWPEVTCPLTVGCFQVVQDSSGSNRDFHMREFTLNSEVFDKPRHVTQYHFRGWPPNDAPCQSTNFIEMVIKIRKENVQNSPVLVHCRQGLGRSGVFCALYNSMDSLDDQGRVCVPSVVRNLRRDRQNMVTSEVEYMFLYKSVLDYYAHGYVATLLL